MLDTEAVMIPLFGGSHSSCISKVQQWNRRSRTHHSQLHISTKIDKPFLMITC